MSLYSLDNFTIINIFKYLTTYELINISHVCRKYRYIVKYLLKNQYKNEYKYLSDIITFQTIKNKNYDYHRYNRLNKRRKIVNICISFFEKYNDHHPYIYDQMNKKYYTYNYTNYWFEITITPIINYIKKELYLIKYFLVILNYKICINHNSLLYIISKVISSTFNINLLYYNKFIHVKYIACNNGIIDINKNRFIVNKPEFYILSKHVITYLYIDKSIYNKNIKLGFDKILFKNIINNKYNINYLTYINFKLLTYKYKNLNLCLMIIKLLDFIYLYCFTITYDLLDTT